MKPIDIIVKEHYVEDIIANLRIPKKYRDDLAQEIYLILLMQKETKLEDLINNNQIKYYITRIITNQALSVRGDFYRNEIKRDTMVESLDPTKYDKDTNEDTDWN